MKFVKIAGVIVGALIITALGIDAADTLRGADGTMLSRVIEGEALGACPSGMVSVATIPNVTCVDAYENAPSPTCSNGNPANMFQTQENVNASCGSVSAENSQPWRFVTREQAAQICAVSGKRLPTASEWYSIALGLPEPERNCNVSTNSVAPAGSFQECASPSRVYDLVGNVWEWVSDDVIEGAYNGRALPETGFIAQVDAGGVATVASSTEEVLFGNDYFWSKQEGAFGMIRGGYYGSGADAGVYTIHADTQPNTAGTAIGFRCVR